MLAKKTSTQARNKNTKALKASGFKPKAAAGIAAKVQKNAKAKVKKGA